MRVHLRGLAEDYVLLRPRVAEALGGVVERRDEAALERLLRAAMLETPVHRLRALLLEGHETIGLHDDAGLLARLVRQLVRGELVLVREARVAVTPSVIEPPEQPPEPEDVVEQLDWIEILVEDEDQNPMPWVVYELILPDGGVRRGRTNDQGIVRFDRIPKGTCKFSLVETDGRAWSLA